jgi:hypothetical protein
MTYAIFSKVANIVRVHYSHLTESQAESEVDRLNSHLQSIGHSAVYWFEDHHPEAIYVIG